MFFIWSEFQGSDIANSGCLRTFKACRRRKLEWKRVDRGMGSDEYIYLKQYWPGHMLGQEEPWHSSYGTSIFFTHKF